MPYALNVGADPETSDYFAEALEESFKMVTETAIGFLTEHGIAGHGYPDVGEDLDAVRNECGRIGLTQLFYVMLNAWTDMCKIACPDADEAELDRRVELHLGNLKPVGGKYSSEAVRLLTRTYRWRPQEVLALLRDRALPRQYTDAVMAMLLLEIRMMGIDGRQSTAEPDAFENGS